MENKSLEDCVIQRQLAEIAALKAENAKLLNRVEDFMRSDVNTQVENARLRAALEAAQQDICRVNCIHGPPRPHCPACVDASTALKGCK